MAYFKYAKVERNKNKCLYTSYLNSFLPISVYALISFFKIIFNECNIYVLFFPRS